MGREKGLVQGWERRRMNRTGSGLGEDTNTMSEVVSVLTRFKIEKRQYFIFLIVTQMEII